MTSYGRPQGLLADPYAGAFAPRPTGLQGLLSDPAMMQQLAQKAQAMGLLDGRGGMGNDAVQMPAADPAAPVEMSGPLPAAPGMMPGTAGQPMAPGMGGQKPGMMGGGATQAAAPSFPGRNIPSGYAMPISPRASLDSLYGMYAPAASAEGKLPAMGLGGLRRMYASPETLAAEAEAAKAAAAQRTSYDGYGPNGRPYDAGGGDGTGHDSGFGGPDASGAAGVGAGASASASADASSGVGGSASGSAGAGAGASGGASADAGGGDNRRKGGIIPSDGDGKLEARRGYVLHEGEIVMNPEAVRMLGRDELLAANRKALAQKKRPMGLLG